MTEHDLARYITETLPNVETTSQFGYLFFFYRNERMMPFATIALPGNEHERASKLDRPGVFRVNIGVTKAAFESLFGSAKPDLTRYDFAALNTLMPHPDYAAQHFVCVLCPEGDTLERTRALLAEAHALAAKRYARPEKN